MPTTDAAATIDALAAIRAAWQRLSGFATCVSSPDEYAVHIRYDSLERAQDGYQALLDIGKALQSVAPLTPAAPAGLPKVGGFEPFVKEASTGGWYIQNGSKEWLRDRYLNLDGEWSRDNKQFWPTKEAAEQFLADLAAKEQPTRNLSVWKR